jgi:hypothetical protein
LRRGPATRPTAPVASIAVDGSVLKITLADGRVRASRDPIDARQLVDQGPRLRRVRLDGIERDPDDKRPDVAISAAVPRFKPRPK